MTEVLFSVHFEVTSWDFFILGPEDLEVIDGGFERSEETFSPKVPERGEDLIPREVILSDADPDLTMLSG